MELVAKQRPVLAQELRPRIGVENRLPEFIEEALRLPEVPQDLMQVLRRTSQASVDHLAAQGISCELIDLRTIRPLDWDTVEQSVRRTGRMLVLDPGTMTGSVAGEIVARIVKACWTALKCAPERLAMPDFPEATSAALTSGYHVRAEHVARRVGEMLGREVEFQSLASRRTDPADVPGTWFRGPF